MVTGPARGRKRLFVLSLCPTARPASPGRRRRRMAARSRRVFSLRMRGRARAGAGPAISRERLAILMKRTGVQAGPQRSMQAGAAAAIPAPATMPPACRWPARATVQRAARGPRNLVRPGLHRRSGMVSRRHRTTVRRIPHAHIGDWTRSCPVTTSRFVVFRRAPAPHRALTRRMIRNRKPCRWRALPCCDAASGAPAAAGPRRCWRSRTNAGVVFAQASVGIRRPTAVFSGNH